MNRNDFDGLPLPDDEELEVPDRKELNQYETYIHDFDFEKHETVVKKHEPKIKRMKKRERTPVNRRPLSSQGDQ